MNKDKVLDKWNNTFKDFNKEKIIYDDFLEKFKEYIINTNKPIIDLGCGYGNNTKYLLENGKEVIPCDYSLEAIKSIKKNFDNITDTKCFDMTKGLEFDDNFSDVVVADLSLHYFDEKTTCYIIQEIKRVLTQNGIILFRVNSINDVNHGAGQGEEINHHYYLNNGEYKRFFDKEDIYYFFKNWNILYLNEEEMNRYSKPKVVLIGMVRNIK